MEEKEFNRLLKELNEDSKAIERIFRFYYPKIVKRLSMKYGASLAEDAAQEFFVHLFETRNDLPHVDNPTSWVYSCAENIAKRKITYDSRYVPVSEIFAAEDQMDKAENKIYTDSLLDKLNPTERKIVYMFHYEGYSGKEIASELKLNPSAVRKIYQRALKKLKKFI